MNSPLNLNLFFRYYHYYLQKGYCFGGHTHPAWEINIIRKGELEVTYDDQIITLKKNMLMICESDVFHRNRVLSPNGAELFVYQFFTDEIPHRKEARVYNLDCSDSALVNLIEEEAEKNAAEVENHSLFADRLNYQAHKLLEILLIRLIDIENAEDYKRNPDELLYKTIINYMKDNVERNIHVDEIAHHCHVSPTKLKNVFGKYAGNTVINYFSDMKINIAKMFLDEGMSIGEVSERLGFSSQPYFSMKFKKKVGMSPSKYKNRSIKN